MFVIFAILAMLCPEDSAVKMDFFEILKSQANFQIFTQKKMILREISGKMEPFCFVTEP
jgi:hypothetical protein